MINPLKLALVRTGRCQYDIAREIGMSETRLSRLATGREVPSADEAEALARLLGRSVDDLFGEGHGERGAAR
jgi:transcriptional regulator with XRE-family HTH domain